MTILNINDNDFEEKVLKEKNVVLCDFWAEWCGPCKQITPILEELSKDFEKTDLTIAKVNIDENPETPSKYGIMSIPTLLLFKEGKLVSTQVGLQQKSELKKWIESHI
ncbi:MAG: Thioredoxin-1 [Alphaproteobacteria bacterium MarineAlpha9_Bin4]|nr:thioredoxin [Pelagibacterales bacterium]PPR27332.1 MAG: Thioredoxin-1 [Alphaproteobacteria bacterium MarineAlpha9_Bin4]|tara:strand:+ start:5486 stop:5809 length:324 start_codon:yes stop_codon:yes gene_type:complete